MLSLEQIYDKVWNEPFLDGGNTVMVHIRNLRDKIEVDSKRPVIYKPSGELAIN